MDDSVRRARPRPPVGVWIVTALIAVMAVVSIAGAFVFAFPNGGVAGIAVGMLLIAAGLAYAVIAWRLRYGERVVWIAALVLPVIQQGGLATLDLVRTGAIPRADYPFIGITLIIVVVLLLPPTRRFFAS